MWCNKIFNIDEYNNENFKWKSMIHGRVTYMKLSTSHCKILHKQNLVKLKIRVDDSYQAPWHQPVWHCPVLYIRSGQNNMFLEELFNYNRQEDSMGNKFYLKQKIMVVYFNKSLIPNSTYYGSKCHDWLPVRQLQKADIYSTLFLGVDGAYQFWRQSWKQNHTFSSICKTSINQSLKPLPFGGNMRTPSQMVP